MKDFEYVAARSIEEVVSILSHQEGPVRILAGGTDLLVQMREGRKDARLVIDIKRIPETTGYDLDPRQGLTIGAAVPCYQLCADASIQAAYPGLVDAVSLIGGMQIQGRASLGGNLCNASPAADSIPALMVHAAVCVVAGPGGRREVPVEAFCAAPGQTVLQPAEFLVAIRLPPPADGFGASYLRFIPRNEMDIAVVGVGVSLTLSPDRVQIQAARVALGAVAPTPLLVEEAGKWLQGQPVSDQVLLQAARMAQAAARPISDLRGSAEQRRHLVGILTRRALAGALQRARAQDLVGESTA